MKAMQKYSYMEKGTINVLHENVIQIDTNKFKCLDCGIEWTQSINSPKIITDIDIYTFYPEDKRISCKQTL